MAQRTTILGLLFVATVTVDVAAMLWAQDQPKLEVSYAVVALHAILLSQVSALCIWSFAYGPANLWARLAPFLAAVLAAACIATTFEEPGQLVRRFVSQTAIFALHTTLLLIALWIFVRTRYWQRRTSGTARWQFSVIHLIIAMTVVAALSVLLRHSELFATTEAGINAMFVVSSVAIAVVCLFVWSLPWHWILRLSATLAAAVTFAGLMEAAVTALYGIHVWPFSLIFGGHYVIQSLLLSAYLACFNILSTVNAGDVQQETVS